MSSTAAPSPLDPVPHPFTDAPTGESFAERVGREAREELRKLQADDIRVHEEIAELQARLGFNREGRKQATGVLLALGLTAELESPRSGDGGVSQLSESAPPASDEAAPSPDAEPLAGASEGWTSPDDDTITAAVMWVGTQENIAFNTGDLAKALDVERTVASGVMDTLVEREVIEPTDETARYFKQRVGPPEPEPDGGKPEAEPSTEPESAGDEAEAPAEPAKPKGRSSVQTGGKKANNQVVTLEMTRDAIKEHFGIGVKFNMRELGEKMGQKSATVSRYVRELAEAGTLVRTGGERGPNVKYEYAKPDPRSGPREHPRHDGPRQTPKGTEHLTAIDGGKSRRGQAVAHTGRTVGRSGKPGRDKKKAELGFRVKAKGKG